MLEEKKSTKILKGYAKLQKVITFAFFFSFILLFIYCLGFFTPYYEVTTYNGSFNQRTMAKFGLVLDTFKQQYCPDLAESCLNVFSKGGSGNINGLNMGYFTSFATNDVQNLNHMLFYFSIAGIVISLILFVYRTQLRKRFYITNHIATGICSVFSLVTCITLFIQFDKYENALNNVDYNLINAYYTSQKDSSATQIINYFSKSTFDFIYTIGRIVLVIMIITTILLILLNVSKAIIYKDFNKKNNEVEGGRVNG